MKAVFLIILLIFGAWVTVLGVDMYRFQPGITWMIPVSLGACIVFLAILLIWPDEKDPEE